MWVPSCCRDVVYQWLCACGKFGVLCSFLSLQKLYKIYDTQGELHGGDGHDSPPPPSPAQPLDIAGGLSLLVDIEQHRRLHDKLSYSLACTKSRVSKSDPNSRAVLSLHKVLEYRHCCSKRLTFWVLLGSTETHQSGGWLPSFLPSTLWWAMESRQPDASISGSYPAPCDSVSPAHQRLQW